MYHGKRIALVIPALDEEQTISGVLALVDRTLVDELIVVDNGSRDQTAQKARQAGARVVAERRRGYGCACLRGIAAVEQADVILFHDADGSDDPAEARQLISRLVEGNLDLVVGSRTLGNVEPGALTPIQTFGNWLTCSLVWFFWGVRFTDLGPFRALTSRALERLDMSDPDFGWTIEMQVKAAQRGLRVAELPVTCRNRQGGRSKVSGTIWGSYRAGRRILEVVLKAKLAEVLAAS
jgi:glycosyltransferase involved in cell wall biosynthesis